MNWQKYYSREYGVQYSEVALWMQFVNDKNITLKPIKNQAFVPENNNECYYAKADEWADLELFLSETYGSNPVIVEKFINDYFDLGNKYVEESKKISGMKYANNKEILNAYGKYWIVWTQYSAALLAAFILNDYYAHLAHEKIQKYIEKITDEKLVKEYEAELLRPSRRAALLQLNDETKNKKFDELFEEYRWLSCLDIHNRPFSKEKFKEFLEHLGGNAKNQHSFEEIALKLNISQYDLELIKIAKDLAYLKDVRDDFRRKGIFYSQPFFELIAKKMNLALEDFSYVLKNEIIEFLRSGKLVEKELVEERRKGFLIFIENEKTVCVSGEDIGKALSEKLHFTTSEAKSTLILEGLAASKGIAEGPARIVKGIDDMKNVQKGDILIAVTTHPDYVVAMNKAIAIVTDEGGMLCHAAIVSREMKKPCVTGTKDATKIFSNGQKVIVDGYKGIVKSA
ncbi:MAG: PEP-utilizing enzyme [archaeon]|mgnify:CR=1 FL=1